MELPDIFEEWTEHASKKNLRKRSETLPVDLSKGKIIALTGVRRSGKTSLLIKTFQNLDGKKAYVNMEDSRLEGFSDVFERLLEWFGREGTLFLDEISSLKGWDGWLSRTHEMHKGKLRIICSSSRGSFIEPSRALRGRVINIELFPLSFSEFQDFTKKTEGFSGYLIQGGFPEVAAITDQTERITVLQEYFNDIVALDVAEASREKIGIVEAFSFAILRSRYFSATKFGNVLKSAGYQVGKSTLLSLEKQMEKAFLFFFVPIFSFNIADRLQYPRKAYSIDNGFLYAITGIEDKGRLYENLAFLILRQRYKQPFEINYWKNKKGHEVDFIIRKGLSVEKLVQVAYELGHDTKKRELRALLEAAEEFDLGEDGELFLINKDISAKEDVDGKTVRFVRLIDLAKGEKI
jgi:hypothetical protein